MKKILLLMTLVVGFSYSAFAGDCVFDTLQDYVADGSCTLDGLTFSDFTYTPSGSNPIPDGSITVTPEDMGGEIGLQFAGPLGALPGDTADALITFTASVDSSSCPGCMIDDLVLTQEGASAGTGGQVNIAETSSVLTGSLAVGATPTVTVLSASATFPPVDSVSVAKDILINGGSTSGLGSQVSAVTNLFSTTTSTVPEPSLVILCTGLLGLVPVARRKFGI